MGILKIEATVDNLNKVIAFIDEQLESHDASMKVQTQIDVAVEEIFVNIASYAYDDQVGLAEISIDYDGNDNSVIITFIDQGKYYNPLEKEDPDITLSAAERQIGGLGIFIVKKSMDKVDYEYRDNSNVLTLVKRLS
ncbi:MAG: ATP-binding protein [Pseudobutyrivibrio sp.]|nr:ATP-binding protein [Pseudobutyrivibrio sp.]